MYCGTQATNMEHPNAGTGLRLPNSVEYYAAVQGVLDAFVLGEGQFEDLDEDANAIAASVRMTTALQQVTGLGDRYALIVTYQKSLNIHVAELTQKERHRSELFPLWAVHAVAGILNGTVILGFSTGASCSMKPYGKKASCASSMPSNKLMNSGSIASSSSFPISGLPGMVQIRMGCTTRPCAPRFARSPQLRTSA